MKVLVVDDDRGSLMVAAAAVQQAGHECITAPDGDAAWTLYQKHRPHVVVTDRNMPGLDGLSLCRAIRDSERDSYTYVVLLTSRGDRDDVLAGMAAGADDYVTKPLDPFTLHTRLLAADRVTSLHAELAGYRNALAAQARTDALTGLHNRLKLTEDLERLESRAERYGEEYCLALCDVDNFKSYNDLYGHPAGDAALAAVGAALAGHARQSDGAYRYGGEEFVVLLPHQSPAAAAVVMERVRRAVQDLGIVHAGDPSGGLTISIGIAGSGHGEPGENDGGARILEDADAALYAAKARGRNTVVLAGAPREAVADQA